MTLTITMWETHGGKVHATASGLPKTDMRRVEQDHVTDHRDMVRQRADQWIREYLYRAEGGDAR